MTVSNLTVVKIGGRFAEDDRAITDLAAELTVLRNRGERILLVHGGGVVISRLQEQYAIKPRFINGLRQTAPEEMPMVDMALAGCVNKHLVRLFIAAGVPAWGLCGADAGILTAESVSGKPEENRTGSVTSINTAPLQLLWNGGYLPVFAPPAADSGGRGINVNADEAALALSAALKADRLLFLSDVPGVLDGSEVIPSLNPPAAEAKIASGVISGGMIPKVRSAVGALSEGVGAVFISDYSVSGDLETILSGRRGTCIETGGI